MHAINLHFPDGRPSNVWMCGKCSHVGRDKESAEACCQLMPCHVCGGPTGRMWKDYFVEVACEACKRAAEAKRELARIERAEKLEAWDGWVWVEGFGYKDGFFESVDALVEHLDDSGSAPENWPEWAYCCKGKPLVVNLTDILESACEDGYEDMDGDLRGVPELEAAVAAFNAANKDVLSYQSDSRRVVRVPRPVEAKGEAR